MPDPNDTPERSIRERCSITDREAICLANDLIGFVARASLYSDRTLKKTMILLGSAADTEEPYVKEFFRAADRFLSEEIRQSKG